MHIILASHGDFCRGALQVYEMVAGTTQGMSAVPLEFDDTGEFAPKLANTVATYVDEGVLILCDIVGGTPFNESYRLSLEHPDKVKVLPNMNLPMLIEAGLALGECPSIGALYELAVQAGLDSMSALEHRDENSPQDESSEDEELF